MGKTNKLTMKRLRARMAAFETVFDVVRLLKEDDLDERALANSGFIDCDKRCKCYEMWNHDVPCENCVTLRAFNEKRRTSKAEIIDGRAYEVVADYVEVDGKPYVLELIKEIEDSDNLTGEEENILDRRRVYFEKTYMDVLTGAYNRRYFEDKIKSGGVSAGVAMIDLDDFKIYNDLYGHDAGDRILGTIAAEMKKCLRSTDKLVRYGGDEFLVVMPGVRKEGFETALHAIMKHVQNCEIAGYAAVKMSVSIGAAMCEDGNVEEAVSRADRLLYRAKKKKDDLVTNYGGYGPDDRDKYTVLVVDDSDINREILTEILKNEYKVLEADGGEAAIEIIGSRGDEISVVLLDIVMSGIDGFEVLKYMNLNHLIEKIPVITISGDESDASVRRAYDLGVADYINRPFDAKVVYRRVRNTINLYEKQRRLISTVSNEIIEKEKISRLLVNILSRLISIHYGMHASHMANVSKYTEILLNRLVQVSDKYKLSNREIFLISTAASLHDLGKLDVDERILNKPGKLTPDEYEQVKKHTVYGAKMVKGMTEYADEPLVKYIYEICRWHHERYDGKGYPDGLKGEEIPITAQVVSIVDAYDALTSERVYKSAYPMEKAVKMILDGECGAFNPLIVECFKDTVDKMN